MKTGICLIIFLLNFSIVYCRELQVEKASAGALNLVGNEIFQESRISDGLIGNRETDPHDHWRDNPIQIYNTTDYDLEFLMQWVATYLELSNIKINVYSLPKRFSHEGVALKRENDYNIYLKRKLGNYKLIVIHEMIHIKQYESNMLEIINESTVYFGGRMINIERTDYKRRPYEIEAHSKDQNILREYNKYVKNAPERGYDANRLCHNNYK